MTCDPAVYDGVALSPGILDQLATDRGLRIQQCRWRYGDAFRETPFPEHRRLAGAFTNISGRAGAGFDGFSGWFPGDHKGCLCSLVPVFART